jgi:hypothetical protein
VYVGIYGYAAALDSKAWIWNNIVYGFNGTNAYGIYKLDGDFTVYAYNNTVYNSRTGFSTADVKFTAKNNISMCDVVDNAFTDFSGTFSTASTNNYSSDTTAPDNAGANPSYENKTLADVDFVSTTSGSEDFHLQATSDAKGVGTDLSSDPNLSFSYDIDDNYRYGSWDIGADEDVEGTSEYRRQITLNCSGRGSSCSAGLSDFPVLIDTTNWLIADKNLLRTVANGGHVYRSEGHDIIFRASDGVTQLDHEIEKYDGSSGTLIAWVRIPTLFDQCPATDTIIYMYYGNAGITDSTVNPTGVWDDGGNNYLKGVWHLSEAAGELGAIKDSTSNNNHGTGVNSPTLGAVGKIDGSLEFDDTNERHVLVADHSTLQLSANMTISAWVNTSDAETDVGIIVNKWSSDSSARNYWLGKLCADSVVAFYVDDLQNVTAGLSLINDGAWHHVIGVADVANSLLRIYVDGLEKNTAAYSGTSRTGTNELHIGNGSGESDQEFDGLIDEVRVSNTARSSCWIGTEYNNQSSPDTFITLGSEEGPGVPTAVKLTSFTATGAGNAVQVDWQTASEFNNIGFHLYRATSPGGPYTRLTDKLISSHPRQG